MIIVCVLLLCGCGSELRGQITMEHYPSAQTDKEASDGAPGDEELSDGAEAVQTDSDIYIVINIDTKKRTIGLGMPGSLRTVQYGYTKATQILDDHGQYMSAARLQPGRAVVLGELDNEATLTRIQLAQETWYQENITRFSIDPSIGMLIIGDTKYRYNEYLRVFSGDQEISLAQISENDVLSVQGLEKQILSVQVTTGHGTIALENTELFEGGWISLGTKIYAKVTPNMTLEVPEGTYQLSVANDGYGDTGTIEVERSQVTTVDLNEYKGEGPKLSQVTFEVYVEDALLYINGESVDYSEPVELRYGVYRLTVIAAGFETWERQLVIHSAEATIQIGEPELSNSDSEEEMTGEDEGDTQEETENSSTTRDTDANGDSASNASGGNGTSTTNSENANTGNYGDYLDTIVDLVRSLTGQSE